LTAGGIQAFVGSTLIKELLVTISLLAVLSGALIEEALATSRLVFILYWTKSTKKIEPGTAVADIQFPFSDSDNSEYRFVFAFSPKYYLHYNILLANPQPTTHNTQHTTTKMDHCHPTLQRLCPLSP
jgi:hypothetical protein